MHVNVRLLRERKKERCFQLKSLPSSSSSNSRLGAESWSDLWHLSKFPPCLRWSDFLQRNGKNLRATWIFVPFFLNRRQSVRSSISGPPSGVPLCSFYCDWPMKLYRMIFTLSLCQDDFWCRGFMKIINSENKCRDNNGNEQIGNFAVILRLLWVKSSK